MTQPRLYLITPPEIPDLAAHAEALEAALAAGDVACLQIRLKDHDGLAAPDAEILSVTERLMPIAHARDVAVVINDRPDLAKAVGADGVHIGQEDASYGEARALLGGEAIVGVTCHASRHLGLEAAEAGADYVAFGAFFPTSTKDAKAAAAPELLQWWNDVVETPCVAIGGITPDNCAPLAAAGADFLAVSGGVWSHPDGPAAAVEAFNAVFEAHGAV